MKDKACIKAGGKLGVSSKADNKHEILRISKWNLLQYWCQPPKAYHLSSKSKLLSHASFRVSVPCCFDLCNGLPEIPTLDNNWPRFQVNHYTNNGKTQSRLLASTPETQKSSDAVNHQKLEMVINNYLPKPQQSEHFTWWKWKKLDITHGLQPLISDSRYRSSDWQTSHVNKKTLSNSALQQKLKVGWWTKHYWWPEAQVVSTLHLC